MAGSVAALCSALALSSCTAQRMPPAGPAAARPFVITFWCAPPLAEFDGARAAEIAAAGFTIVGPPCEGGLDPELTRRALDVAQGSGLRMWVADHRFGIEALDAPDWEAGLTAAVAAYRGHPALDGYFVADEPPAPQFERVAALVGALRRADPSPLAYVNLLPDFIPPKHLGADSWEDYVEGFVATVRPQLLSYDYYPFGKEKDRSTFFGNLAAMRAAAVRHDLPFMLIVLAMPHGPYREPSEAELAWQVFHALAYGARGISYFTYWTPPPGDWNNRAGLVEHGRPTLRYFQVARLNGIVRAMADALQPYRSLAVADALGEIGVPFPIGPIDGIDGGPVTAGLFGNGQGRLAVLLVNRDYRYGVTARLRRRAGTLTPDEFDPARRVWERAESDAFVLPPGGARLLRWRVADGWAE